MAKGEIVKLPNGKGFSGFVGKPIFVDEAKMRT